MEGFCILRFCLSSTRSRVMIKRRKLSETLAVRIPTLSEAVLDLDCAIGGHERFNEGYAGGFWHSAFGCVCPVQNSALSSTGYRTNAVVLLIGMTYGPRMGHHNGGLPVWCAWFTRICWWARRGAVLMGPTGGYLFGFLLAGVAMGFLAERGMGRTVVSTIAAMFIGNCVIYLCGALWLANFIGFGQAIAAGVLPFLAVMR